MKVYSNKKKSVTANTKVCRPVMAGESYGWVVESYEANEAYEFACDYFGKEYLDSDIVACLGSDALADILAYIFRMEEFREWYNRDGDDDDDDVEASTKIAATERHNQQSERGLKKYYFTLIGKPLEGYSAIDHEEIDVFVEAKTIEDATKIMENAIRTVERFRGMRIYYEDTCEESELFDPDFYNWIHLYDINGNLVNGN